MGWMWRWWLFGIGLLVLLVWAIARAMGTSGPTGGEESAEAILKRRYARGELGEQEYERKLTNLRKSRGGDELQLALGRQ